MSKVGTNIYWSALLWKRLLAISISYESHSCHAPLYNQTQPNNKLILASRVPQQAPYSNLFWRTWNIYWFKANLQCWFLLINAAKNGKEVTETGGYPVNFKKFKTSILIASILKSFILLKFFINSIDFLFISTAHTYLTPLEENS